MTRQALVRLRAVTADELAMLERAVDVYRDFLAQMGAYPGFANSVAERLEDLDVAQQVLTAGEQQALVLTEPAARALRLSLDHLAMPVLRGDAGPTHVDVPALVALCHALEAAAQSAGYAWE